MSVSHFHLYLMILKYVWCEIIIVFEDMFVFLPKVGFKTRKLAIELQSEEFLVSTRSRDHMSGYRYEYPSRT